MIKLIKPAISQAQRKKEKEDHLLYIRNLKLKLIEEFCLSESGENGERNMVKWYNVQFDILFAFAYMIATLCGLDMYTGT